MSLENDFRRVRTSLMLEGKPDRVPLCELHVDREVKEAFLGRPIRSAQDEIDFWITAGYDFVPLSAGLLEVGGVLSGEATLRKTHEYTVYGDRRREVTWAAEGEGVITTREQFEAFPWPNPDDISLTHIEQVAELLPERMRVIVIIGKILTATWMLMGMTGFGLAAAFDRDLLADVFARVAEIQFRTFERALDLPKVGALWMSDDMAYGTGLLCSPTILRDHVFNVYRRMGDLCAERDMPFALHSDGDLTPILADIVKAGFRALHPIEPKAMNAQQVKAEWGDRLCLLGNIDVDLLARGTPEQVAAAVRYNIDTLGREGGYCVGSANSVTYYVPLANFRAMIETALEYGVLN
ncbi:MAG: uroporphyrinogen decarboxylase family protein [Candidatus Zipacnadales bacterium]